MRTCFAAAFLLAATTVMAGEENPYIYRSFEIRPEIYSYVPGDGVDSIQRHGSGMATAGSKLGLGVRIDGESQMVEMLPYVEDGRFWVKVEVGREEAKPKQLELTTLRPAVYEVGTDADGRVYQLVVVPSLNVTDSTPRPFDVEAMRLHHWSFPSCSVLVNDTSYAGKISGGRSPVAFLDICETAMVEFSLFEVDGWTPWGVLDNGNLTLRNPDEECTIEVSGVRNGNGQITLPGGPYRVWVNWKPSRHTYDSYREDLTAYREKIESGEMKAHPNAIAFIDNQLEREPGPWLINSGVRGYSGNEKVNR